MKTKTITIRKISLVMLMTIFIAALAGCQEEVTDFGFDGQISGMVLDQNGNPVSGDVSNAAFTVFILGEEDRIPLELRVNHDGSYANLHLYPQAYSVWVKGPVDAPAEKVVNLTGNRVEHNITVTPFLTIPQPTATIAGGQISVNFEINPHTGHTPAERAVFVSTVAKVGVNTGNGARWQTRRVNVNSNSGTATVVLDANLLKMVGNDKLYVRVAARSTQATGWNYSIPIDVGL